MTECVRGNCAKPMYPLLLNLLSFATIFFRPPPTQSSLPLTRIAHKASTIHWLSMRWPGSTRFRNVQKGSWIFVDSPATQLQTSNTSPLFELSKTVTKQFLRSPTLLIIMNLADILNHLILIRNLITVALLIPVRCYFFYSWLILVLKLPGYDKVCCSVPTNYSIFFLSVESSGDPNPMRYGLFGSSNSSQVQVGYDFSSPELDFE